VDIKFLSFLSGSGFIYLIGLFTTSTLVPRKEIGIIKFQYALYFSILAFSLTVIIFLASFVSGFVGLILSFWGVVQRELFFSPSLQVMVQSPTLST
jgi:hypothetical protein